MLTKLNNVEYDRVNEILKDECFTAVRLHYASGVAARSGIFLIEHIIEGLMILVRLGARRTAMQAWCLHPIVQSNDDLVKTVVKGIPVNFGQHHIQPIILAMEYRAVANSYLSDMSPDIAKVKEDVNRIPQIRQMLIADKIQNRKDFAAQPEGTYPNEDALNTYFEDWLENILELDPCDVDAFEFIIDKSRT